MILEQISVLPNNLGKHHNYLPLAVISGEYTKYSIPTF